MPSALDASDLHAPPPSPAATREGLLELVHGLDAIVWEMDLDTWRFTFVSDPAEAMLGYPIRRWLEEDGFWADVLLHSDDRDEAVNFCTSATREGRDHDFDYRARTADGRIVWLRDVVRVVKDDEGTPVALRGILLDVSERREAERRLGERERELARAYRIASLGAWSWDVTTNRATWSDELHRIYGVAPGEFGGTAEDFFGLVHPEDRPRVEAEVARSVASAEALRFVARVRHGSGEWIVLRTEAEVETDSAGRPVRIVGICQDVTQEVAAEEQERQLLVETLARQRAERERAHSEFLVEAGATLFGSLDPEEALANLARVLVPGLGDWCTVDLVDAESSELRRVEIAHSKPELEEIGWRFYREHGDESDARTGAPEVVRTGEPELVAAISEEALRAAGISEEAIALVRQLGLASYMVVPLQARGRTIGAITMIRDQDSPAYEQGDLRIALEIAGRAGLAIDNARLYQELERERARLARLSRELERSNRELDQFAYVTSHDLKAPLRAIATLAAWVEDDLGDALTGESRQHLELLRGRVGRMEALIEGLLEYSRAGRVRHRPETIDLAALVADQAEVFAPSRDLALVIQGELPVVHGERLPLQQVVQNLLSNAWKHARERIEVFAEDRGELWEIAIRDDGPGIEPKYQERIWGVFQMLQSRDEVEGTGIGLAIVAKIVEDQGGRAWVESAPDEGATFRFTWPKRPRPVAR